MANIPKPENDDSLELNVRYQPDMVLEGMLDATVPEFTQLTLTMGDDVYDLTGGGLPDYSEANDGDALIIEDGEPTWGAVDALPEIEETDEGKVLAVDQGEAVWADAPSGLPEITAQDEGKVLTVVEGSTYTVVGTVFPTQVFDFTETPDAIAQDSNLAYFTEGDTVRLTVGNSTYFATVIDDDGLVAEFSEGPISVIYEGTDEDQGYIKCGSRSGTGEVTAKLENVAADLEAQWAEPSGGGGLVFSPVEDTENPGRYTFTGATPLEVATAFNNGVPCYIHIVASDYGQPSFDSVWQINACSHDSLQLVGADNEDITLYASQMIVSEDNGTNYVALTTYIWDYVVDEQYYRLYRIDTLLTGTPN